MQAGIPITIVIAEDHPLYRKALKDLLSGNSGMTVVGETGDGTQVMSLLRQLCPGVLILDLNLPGVSGLQLAQQICDEGLQVKIIALTMHNEEAMFNDVMDAGVHGYMLKESAVDSILDGITMVAAGEYYISPTLTSYLVNRHRRREALREQHPDLDLLTPTERKILKLVSQDRTSKQIAEQLFISEKTVQNHRMNICNKLHLHGSNGLLKFAIENRSNL